MCSRTVGKKGEGKDRKTSCRNRKCLPRDNLGHPDLFEIQASYLFVPFGMGVKASRGAISIRGREAGPQEDLTSKASRDNGTRKMGGIGSEGHCRGAGERGGGDETVERGGGEGGAIVGGEGKKGSVRKRNRGGDEEGSSRVDERGVYH